MRDFQIIEKFSFILTGGGNSMILFFIFYITVLLARIFILRETQISKTLFWCFLSWKYLKKSSKDENITFWCFVDVYLEFQSSLMLLG